MTSAPGLAGNLRVVCSTFSSMTQSYSTSETVRTSLHPGMHRLNFSMSLTSAHAASIGALTVSSFVICGTLSNLQNGCEVHDRREDHSPVPGPTDRGVVLRFQLRPLLASP